MTDFRLRRAQIAADCTTFLEWMRLRESRPTKCANKIPFGILRALVTLRDGDQLFEESSYSEYIVDDVMETCFKLRERGDPTNNYDMLEILVEFSKAFVLHGYSPSSYDKRCFFNLKFQKQCFVPLLKTMISVLSDLFSIITPTKFQIDCQIIFLQTMTQICEERFMKRIITTDDEVVCQREVKQLCVTILENYFQREDRAKTQILQTFEVLMRKTTIFNKRDSVIETQQLKLYRDLCDNEEFLQSDTLVHVVIIELGFMKYLLETIYNMTLFSLPGERSSQSLRFGNLTNERDSRLWPMLIVKLLKKFKNLWLVAVICECDLCDFFLGSSSLYGMPRMLKALVHRMMVTDDETFSAPLIEIIRSFSREDVQRRFWYCLYTREELLEMLHICNRIDFPTKAIQVKEIGAARFILEKTDVETGINRKSVAFLLAPQYHDLIFTPESQEKGVPLVVLSADIHSSALLELRTHLTEVIQKQHLDRVFFEARKVLPLNLPLDSVEVSQASS